ncbi:MAG: glycine reductase, partial [Gammaproteobacteria bacterium]
MCHQTVCLVARHLEAHGIPTLVLGSAHDILAAGRPPRAAFVDYPLGHSAGKPFDSDDQDSVITGALRGFTSLTIPAQILTLPNQWADDGWREDASGTAAEDTRQPRD